MLYNSSILALRLLSGSNIVEFAGSAFARLFAAIVFLFL